MSNIKSKTLKEIVERTQIEGRLTVGFNSVRDKEMYLRGWNDCIEAFIYFLKTKGDIDIKLDDK